MSVCSYGKALSCMLVKGGGQDMNICKNYPIVGVLFITIFYPYVALAVCNPSGTSCSACTTYRCNSGYYGTALSASRGCTRCPTNATCAGGNNSTFVCNTGYYKNGSECAKCPSSGTTSGNGATTITQCYIPSGTKGSDSTGQYEYIGNCYYIL